MSVLLSSDFPCSWLLQYLYGHLLRKTKDYMIFLPKHKTWYRRKGLEDIPASFHMHVTWWHLCLSKGQQSSLKPVSPGWPATKQTSNFSSLSAKCILYKSLALLSTAVYYRRSRLTGSIVNNTKIILKTNLPRDPNNEEKTCHSLYVL